MIILGCFGGTTISGNTHVSKVVYIPGTLRCPLFWWFFTLQNNVELPIKTIGPVWVLGMNIYIYTYKSKVLFKFLIWVGMWLLVNYQKLVPQVR